MILGLSTAAAPDLPLNELVEACRRRGLRALELVTGHGHGLTAQSPADQLRWARQLTTLRDVQLAAVAPASDDRDQREEAIGLAARLRVPVVLRAAALSGDELVQLPLGGRNTDLLLLHGSDPSVASGLIEATCALDDSTGTARLAWEIDPASDDPAAVRRVLELAARHLGLIRLRGGGPESVAQTGLGVGSLMASLALARYAGPLILTPTTPRHHFAWSAWLGRRGGWGCGSKQSDPDLVPLAVGMAPTQGCVT